MKRALLLSLIALTGCATTEAVPRVETYAINVPVAVSCVPDDFPARPSFPDEPQDLLKAMDAASRAILLERGYGMHRTWEQALEEVLGRCRHVK